jgi:hypothetical protein
LTRAFFVLVNHACAYKTDDMKKKCLLIIVNFMLGFYGVSQKIVPYNESKEFKINFNETGSHYVKMTFLNQVWLRYNQSNPGTQVYGTPKSETYDIGLRRTRVQLFGQLSNRVFFYTQFGQNNLSNTSPRKQGLFFLDAITEYTFVKRYLSIGAGLTGWNGLSRYAAPSVGSILTMDAPLYQQATNDINDQFLRKLSVYAKGKIGKLDYRLIVSDPMSIQKATVSGGTLNQNSTFSTKPGNEQFHGYLNYQFLDEESNLLPYTTGSYLGKKKVFNLGVGFLVQKDAMWHLNSFGDTNSTNLELFSIDAFYDVPLNNEKLNAITAYIAYQNSNYGKNYVRNIGAMNPGTEANSQGSFNGAGSAFPMIGSGNTLYAQAAYLFRKDLLKDQGTLQPYVGVQLSKFNYIKTPLAIFDCGVNWLIDGHRSKMSLNYQNRPIVTVNGQGENSESSRRSMIVLQYQISL